jgi:glycosyltransferase involved in cell wall biosynthesis
MFPLTFLVAGRVTARTGGSIYNRRMIDALRQQGWNVTVGELDGSFPFPTPAARCRAGDALARVPDGGVVVIDGLAFGAMPDEVEHASPRLSLVALVHLPLAATIGVAADVVAALARSERRALAHATQVVVTGRGTEALMAEHGLTHRNIAVVEPGTDRAPLARGSGSTDVHLLTVATLNPGKGHVVLLEALAMLPHRDWRLACAGDITKYPDTVAQVRRTIRQLGLDDRVSLLGELEGAELDRAYDRTDVFVLASERETYGMAVAEALARGVPVVGTATGTVPELVSQVAGLVVPPSDTAALATALGRMIRDAPLRARCALGARQVRERLPRWDDAAARLGAALIEGRTHG